MVFTVYKPFKGHDEDAPPYADDKMLIVCDGLAGGGQNKYLIDGQERTSAYLGSRQISNACCEYFEAHYEEICLNMQNPRNIINDLKDYISDELSKYVENNGLKNLIKGKSMQMLPSTMVSIIYKQNGDYIDALVLSAGDSRAFMLSPEMGLQQLSKDDVFDDVDAFDKSSTMTNNIRQDGPFHINYNYYRLPQKCILFVCSDGCFDYVNSPMELEYRIEYSIIKCGDVLDPEKNSLGDYFGLLLENSGLKDDCTMAGAILGYSDSDEIKNEFLQRARVVREKYRIPYSDYERKSIKRKNEIKDKIQETESQKSSIESRIKGIIKNSIIDAFKCNNLSGEDNRNDSITSLINRIRDFDKYQFFLAELSKKNEEKRRSKKEKEEQYYKVREDLKKRLFEIRYQTAIDDAKKSNIKVSIFNSVKGKDKILCSYIKHERKIDDLRFKFNESIEVFYNAFEELKVTNLMDKDFSDKIRITSEKFKNLENIFYSKICREIDGFNEDNEELKTILKEEIEENLIDWEKSGSRRLFNPEDDEIKKLSDKLLNLKVEIESCKPLTLDEEISEFEKYYDTHYMDFVSFVMMHHEISGLICGNDLETLKALEERLVKLKDSYYEFDGKKRKLWLEYKPGYERFNISLGGTV